MDSLFGTKQFHDDVIKWNIFPATGPLWGESIGQRWFPSQKPVTQSFDVFFDLRLNKRLSKQPRRRWFETPSHSLWRHCNVPRPVITLVIVNQIFHEYTAVTYWWKSEYFFKKSRKHYRNLGVLRNHYNKIVIYQSKLAKVLNFCAYAVVCILNLCPFFQCSTGYNEICFRQHN